MGIFDKFIKKEFIKKEQTTKPLTSIRIGDWVTQYSAGYWMVTNIFPKYADEDYSYGNNSWKKGDRLGDWVVVKKGFTAKIIISAADTASQLSVVILMAGNSFFTIARLLYERSDNQIFSAATFVPRAKPLARAPPIFPAPIIAIFII